MLDVYYINKLTRFWLPILDVPLWPECVSVMIHSLIRFGLPIAHVILWPYLFDVWYIGLLDLGSRLLV